MTAAFRDRTRRRFGPDERGLVLVEYLMLFSMVAGLIGIAYAVMEGNAEAFIDVAKGIIAAD